MTRAISKLAVAALLATGGAAYADVTTVNCTDFLVTLEEADTIKIQEIHPEQAAFDKAVCDAAVQLPIDEYKDPTRVDVRVEPAGYELMVVVEKLTQNN